MKNRVLLTVLVAILFGLQSVAQNPEAWGRKKYLNIAWVDQTLKNTENDLLKWKSEFGVSLVKGTTYYLHSKPLFGMLKFGIDWTQMDINYAKLEEDFPRSESASAGNGGGFADIITPDIYKMVDLGKHQFEYSMHLGVSVTINPVDYLKVNGYFRYAPSFSGILYENEDGDTEFSCGYGSFFVSGGAVSYKVISLGVEARWGSGKYKSFAFDSDAVLDDLEVSDAFTTDKVKMKTNSTRFYISFRF